VFTLVVLYPYHPSCTYSSIRSYSSSCSSNECGGVVEAVGNNAQITFITMASDCAQQFASVDNNAELQRSLAADIFQLLLRQIDLRVTVAPGSYFKHCCCCCLSCHTCIDAWYVKTIEVGIFFNCNCLAERQQYSRRHDWRWYGLNDDTCIVYTSRMGTHGIVTPVNDQTITNNNNNGGGPISTIYTGYH
jgi:hypothetical protein